MKFTLKSNAKINVGLNVLGKLENGYHLLDMVMVPISLADTINGEILNEAGDLEIKTNKFDIPTDKKNILYKIYDSFYEKVNIPKRKVSLYLEKIIPHEAGLGGGSSNGGFFLKFLNFYHGNILSLEEMIELGTKIGADIPFFIINKSGRLRGIGEKIEIFENNLQNEIMIVKPKFGVSTKVAYEYSDLIENKANANIEEIIFGLKENNLEKVEKNIKNNLEEGLLKIDENIINFRKFLKGTFKQEFFMSGSGSAYFTFLDNNSRKEVLNNVQDIEFCEIYFCKFL